MIEVDQTLKWGERFVDGKKEQFYIMPKTPKLPRPDPRDDHLLDQMTEKTKYWINYVVDKRETMQKEKHLFIPGQEMTELLKYVFGAKDEDFEELRNVCDNMNQDPHLKFRKSSMYRLGFDLKRGTARRLQREPFILTEDDGFKRHDSGMCRFFGEPQAWIFENSAFQALMRFKAFMMYGVSSLPRRGCDPDRNWNMCGFFLRTETTPQILGEPAAEGVHMDGVEFTMTTLFKAVNMRADSAVTQAYSLDQELGVQRDEANPDTILGTFQHVNYLDTLIFVDNEMSHSVSPLFQDDPTSPATRDMAVIFTRRMAKRGGGFSAEPFDSETGHATLPFAMGIKSRHVADHYPSDTTDQATSMNH